MSADITCIKLRDAFSFRSHTEYWGPRQRTMLMGLHWRTGASATRQLIVGRCWITIPLFQHGISSYCCFNFKNLLASNRFEKAAVQSLGTCTAERSITKDGLGEIGSLEGLDIYSTASVNVAKFGSLRNKVLGMMSWIMDIKVQYSVNSTKVGIWDFDDERQEKAPLGVGWSGVIVLIVMTIRLLHQRHIFGSNMLMRL